MSRKGVRSNSAHFLALRRRLDAMGYGDYPLGLDSAPLAQIMLEDLVATTEALRDSEESSDGVMYKLQIAEQLLEPLQIENTKLRRDNTQLHKELITVGEETLKLQNKQATMQFNLQAENRRITLQKQQVEEQLDLTKRDLISVKAQLAQALEPTTSKISSRAPSEKSSRRRSSSKDSISNISTSSILSTSQVDIDTVPKNEFDQLSNENEYLKQQVNEFSTQLEGFKASIKLRDEEIERLGNELNKETGKNGYIITLRHKCQKAEEEVERMKTQMRLINPNVQKTNKSDSKSKKQPKAPLQISKITNFEVQQVEQIENKAKASPQKIDSERQKNSANNELIESLTAKLEQKESVIAELTAALAFVGDNLNKSILLGGSDKALAEIERRMREMQNHYEAEIDKLTAKLNQSGFISKDAEIQKMIANTASLDGAFRNSSTEQSEIEELRKKLKEANEQLQIRQDSDIRYHTILEQLKKEHQAMKKEIAMKTEELEKLKKRQSN